MWKISLKEGFLFIFENLFRIFSFPFLTYGFHFQFHVLAPQLFALLQLQLSQLTSSSERAKFESNGAGDN